MCELCDASVARQVVDLEQAAELQAEVNVLLERNTALQHKVTRLERANKVMEQRLRRIGDAVVEGRIVDGE